MTRFTPSLLSRAVLPALSTLAVSFALLAGTSAAVHAQTQASPPLYPGEAELYAKAAEEGLVVSFDTGPEWANWKALFAEFRKRYPKVEI
ncbi:hypothetical protein ACU80S_19730, partial [Pandoraea sputorum]